VPWCCYEYKVASEFSCWRTLHFFKHSGSRFKLILRERYIRINGFIDIILIKIWEWFLWAIIIIMLFNSTSTIVDLDIVY